jgi:hypothetical protein
MEDLERLRNMRDAELKKLAQRQRDVAEGRLVPMETALKVLRCAIDAARAALNVNNRPGRMSSTKGVLRDGC